MNESVGVLQRGICQLLCGLTRNFRNLPGRWRLLKHLKRREDLVASLPPKTVRIWTGSLMHLNPKDFVSRHIYMAGDYETTTSRLFGCLLKGGDLAVDVGANIGYFTLIASNMVGPTGRVLAFEASSSIFEKAKKNLELNSASNVRLLHQAVSDRVGEVTFHIGDEDHLGVSSMRSIGTSREETVTTTSLDDAVGGDDPRLIKIDVEGTEHLVLGGMRGLLKRCKPYLILELTDSFLREMGSSADSLVADLHSEGYDLYSIEWNGIVPHNGAVKAQENVFCVPADFVDGKWQSLLAADQEAQC